MARYKFYMMMMMMIVMMMADNRLCAILRKNFQVSKIIIMLSLL